MSGASGVSPGAAALVNAVDGYVGQASVADGAAEFDQTAFLVKSLMGKTQTATLVRITAVTNVGALAAVGFVDAKPMVHQVDGAGTPTPHGTIHCLPYFRLQGGANAVIIDPQVGDIGLAVFASRDISSVKSTKKESTPGSRRRNDMADGLYLGGVLNGVPTQVIAFSATGITVTSPTKVTINCPSVEITGASLKHNGKDVGSTHTHSDPQGGATGVPV